MVAMSQAGFPNSSSGALGCPLIGCETPPTELYVHLSVGVFIGSPLNGGLLKKSSSDSKVTSADSFQQKAAVAVIHPPPTQRKQSINGFGGFFCLNVTSASR